MKSFKSLISSRLGTLCAISFVVLLSAAACFFYFNGKKTGIDSSFSKYIESYTSGIISKTSSIRVRLARPNENVHTLNEALPEDVFKVSPSVKGKAYWVDERTLEFKPEKNLEAATSYTVSFDLGKIMHVGDRYKQFEFNFQTSKPNFEVSFVGLRSATNTSTDMMKVEGSVLTADQESDESIEKLIHVEYASKVDISWVHNPYSRTHNFTINKLKRLPKGDNPLAVSWDGSSLNMVKKGKQAFDIPAIGDFRLLDMKAVQDQEQYVLVQFSDPIMLGQELDGLIGIKDASNLSYSIDGSTVKVYTAQRLEGEHAVFVNQGVESITHLKIAKKSEASLVFENNKPAISIPGKGTILPSSGKLLMPFEAINLNAVDVSIIKVYEDNVPQYYQNTSLGGDNGDDQLRRVGRPVAEKTIRLDGDKSINLTKKNRFMLDLDKLIKAEPGAIYRVVLGFRRAYSLFSCKAGETVSPGNDDNDYEAGRYADYDSESDYSSDKNVDDDDAFWSRFNGGGYPPHFKWEDRDNPCTDSYYIKEKWATRSIIGSNIGLIAKMGADKSMVVVATDILTAKPLSGVELDLLDYQKQVLYKTTSDSYGLAKFNLKRTPFLLVAKRGAERGYLKLDNASSLPLTRFDVGGEQIPGGVKGFIYGERGVWRPGDSIFLSFVMEDKLNKLPTDLPVVMEFYNPNGQLQSSLTRSSSVDGFYSFHLATQISDITGNWSAKVKVGGAEFEKTIKVETIMPNRLKLDLSFGDKKELTKGENTSGTLNAKWLFGGIAQNLKAKVDAYIRSEPTKFKGFDDYDFDDPTRSFVSKTETVFDGALDEQGNTTISADVNIDKEAPGQLTANFQMKVFEPGGRFSVGQVSIPYNVYKGYVGIKSEKGDAYSGVLYTDQSHTFNIVDVDTKGQLLAGKRSVRVELYKVQWRWWWDRSSDETSNFTQDKLNKLVEVDTVDLVNGKGAWAVKIAKESWGRYLVRVKDEETGHVTGKYVYFDWSNYAERLQKDNPTEASMLSFTSDKESYKVGEEAVLTIPTPDNGRALISIENGSSVLKTTWISTKRGQTQYRFKIEPGMAPNIFVNMTLLQPHSQTINDLPIRMYGAIPLMVEDPATQLRPVVNMPDKIEPEASSALTVSEASGKEMTYTVALVDEGLLDLTNFKTPNPHEVFYAREALGVKTWDLYDYVIGAYGNDMERILSIGGDKEEDMAAPKGKSADKNNSVNRFKPVVKFMGPFHLNAGEKKTHKFVLPQYIGMIKAMVIAGHKGAYGFAEKEVSVKKPLMIQSTLPRVLGPSEKIQLPVTVFALENSVKTVSIEVQSNAFSNLAGNNRKTISFIKPGEQMLTFDLNVKDFVGVGKVRVIAQSGSQKAVSDVTLEVRNPNPPITKVFEKELAPGEAWSQDYTAIGMTGTNKTTIECSNIPPLNLARRLDELIEYPYGCVEQTTSAVFPQLYLNTLTNLSTAQQARTGTNIKSGILRLQGFQTPSGGLSYWPGDLTPDEWGTNYAGHFMLAAQSAGYKIPAGFLEHWKNYQRKTALSWAPNSRSFYGADLVQAYRLYLLALAHSPELGAMNRLKEFPYLSSPAKWSLAAAYKLAGQPEIALKMISGLSEKIKPYNLMYGTYGSDLRDQAMMLETLTLLGQNKRASALMQTIAARLSQDSWYSTQTTAYSLLAIAHYCGKNASGNKLILAYQANGDKGDVNSNSYIWSHVLKEQSGRVIARNKGTSKLYLRLIQRGQPVSGLDVEPIDHPSILKMQISYSDLKGDAIDPSVLKQGTDFVAKVTITNPGNRGRYDNMALSQIFPSGWEILNTRMTEGMAAFNSSASDYMDIRDDRVYTYFSLGEGSKVVYYVMLNAAYLGKFYQPPFYCEAMYDRSISALAKGRWVSVEK